MDSYANPCAPAPAVGHLVRDKRFPTERPMRVVEVIQVPEQRSGIGILMRAAHVLLRLESTLPCGGGGDIHRLPSDLVHVRDGDH